jgi:hypothetical protein
MVIQFMITRMEAPEKKVRTRALYILHNLDLRKNTTASYVNFEFYGQRMKNAVGYQRDC